MSQQLIASLKKWKEVGALSMVAAVVLSIVTDSVKDGLDQGVVVRLLVFLIVIGILYLVAWYFTRPYKISTALTTQQQSIPQCKVVLTALSPLHPGDSNIDVITNLVQHHAAKLETLVLVCTPENEGVQRALNVLHDWLVQTYHDTPRLHPDHLLEIVAVKPNSEINDVFAMVTDKLDYLTAQHPLRADDVYIDVTAGFKPFSIAFMLVAQKNGHFLSYQVTRRGPDGKPIGPAQLTLLKLDHQLTREP